MPELTSIPGLFDTIHVVDSFPARKVFACGKLQGSMTLDPQADQVYPTCPPGPGPVTTITYQLAWLMAGVRHPHGCGLMLGLGAGSGAVALLHHFPQLSLQVVEIDPAMIRVAREYFPLVHHFERQGRLEIINANAADFASASAALYDFALIDISIDAADAQMQILSRTFSEAVMRIAGEVWINALTAKDAPFLGKLMRAYEGLTTLFSSEPLTAWLPIKRNWITTNASLDMKNLQALQPYPGLNSDSAEKARRIYAELLTHRLSCSEICTEK